LLKSKTRSGRRDAISYFSPYLDLTSCWTMWSGAGGAPNPVLLARNAYVEMIKTAQNVADRYELTREEIDAFALRSHQHAAAARDSGRLAVEIHPVEIPGTRKEPGRTFEHDEMIRGDTTAELLAIAKALGRAGLAPNDVDIWEVHEAFAAQALGVLRELPHQLDGFEVPDERLNPNGGAVARCEAHGVVILSSARSSTLKCSTRQN
jgi:acetyl-CoA acetyltransferase